VLYKSLNVPKGSGQIYPLWLKSGPDAPAG